MGVRLWIQRLPRQLAYTVLAWLAPSPSPTTSPQAQRITRSHSLHHRLALARTSQYQEAPAARDPLSVASTFLDQTDRANPSKLLNQPAATAIALQPGDRPGTIHEPTMSAEKEKPKTKSSTKSSSKSSSKTASGEKKVKKSSSSKDDPEAKTHKLALKGSSKLVSEFV